VDEEAKRKWARAGEGAGLKITKESLAVCSLHMVCLLHGDNVPVPRGDALLFWRLMQVFNYRMTLPHHPAARFGLGYMSNVWVHGMARWLSRDLLQDMPFLGGLSVEDYKEHLLTTIRLMGDREVYLQNVETVTQGGFLDPECYFENFLQKKAEEDRNDAR
jgi:hypothetical protein